MVCHCRQVRLHAYLKLSHLPCPISAWKFRQVPALAMDKVCIVVSPLISLMEDQVSALQARGISAAFLGSAQSDWKVIN